MSKQTWLSMDPGTGNFALTVFRYNTKTGRVKLLHCQMLTNPIKNLTANPIRSKPRKGKKALERDEPTFEIGYQLFRDEIEWIFDNFKITHAVAERFQSRGGFNSGDQGELISMMLGIVFTVAKDRGAVFFTTIAGVWKQAVARLGIDLQSVYDCGKITFRMEPHPIDSTLIGLWHANREKQWPIVKYLPRLSQLLSSAP
jgi:hypothetical protein